MITDHWEKQIQEIEPTIKKIFVLRNCVEAHISIKLDTAAAFKKAQMTPDNFKQVIDSTLKIWQVMNGMTEQVSSVLLDQGTEDTTRQLLLDLKSFKTSQI